MSNVKSKKNDTKEKRFTLRIIQKIFIKISSKWVYILLFLVAYGILFFFLRNKILFTPDFGGSDAANNIPGKYYVWKAIKTGVFPLWTDLLDGGYPILAESQIGVFYLPYYIFSYITSSLSHYISLLFVFHLFLLTLGMYLLLKQLRTPSFLSFLLSIIFAWNGSIAFRWVHSTVIQSFSYTPFLFLIYLKWRERNKIRYLLAISFIVSLMMFAGFVQCVFMAILGLIILYFVQNYPVDIKKTLVFFCSFIFGLLLSLPQIVPTLQLSRYANRTLSNTYEFAVSIPFKIKDLCSFFSSTCVGSAKNATYATDWQKNGIYWENTPYIGEIFVILLLFFSVYYFVKRKNKKQAVIFLGLSFLFTLFALGDNSPIYFIFSIFPFSVFRTPGRYLLYVVFFLVIYSSFILSYIVKKSKNYFLLIFIYSALIINCGFLIHTSFMYHVFIDSQVMYKSLATQAIIKPKELYLTYGGVEAWNKLYLQKGWAKNKIIDTYLFINGALLPNMNLYSGQAHFGAYVSLGMRRQKFLQSIIADSVDLKGNSAQTENLLHLYNISSIISFKSLHLPHFKPTQILKKDGIIITTFQSKWPQEIYYVPKTVSKVRNLEEVEYIIKRGLMTQNFSVAEAIPSPVDQNSENITIQSILKNNETIKSIIIVPSKKYIAVKKGWYPEWQLFIDGKRSTIYKTNLIHMGFYVPQGRHTVEFRYIPTSLYIGYAISGVSIIFISLILLFMTLFRKRILKK